MKPAHHWCPDGVPYGETLIRARKDANRTGQPQTVHNHSHGVPCNPGTNGTSCRTIQREEATP